MKWLILAACLFSQGALAQNLNSGQPLKKSPGNSTVVMDGDSVCTTNNEVQGLGNTFLIYATKASGRNFKPINTCLAGATILLMNTNFAANITANYSAAFTTFLVEMFGGGNDIRGGATGATTYARLKTYAASVKALGSNAHFAVGTYYLPCDIFMNAPQLTELQSFNNLIYANWNVPQSAGGLEADYLSDYFGEPIIGANTYASSALCPTTYSSDGIHLNTLGKTIQGPVGAAAIAKSVPVLP